ncbi:neuronal acetylcholine receptor subunit alpha-7-like [Elysia marginata]|uniref:Neuronal acetylcholine receptor subunit alpha-7-like n=1 Tax=Elysia marginata TaxID=1093978 RepID=A0AAV4IUK7_9GAST|nr:neuronal acetylcholine receptor subunit alpha-7-like [Elysia marginata]
MLFPMMVSGLLGPVAFLIPPDDAEKVSVAVTVLLATAVFMGTIHDNLPEKSDQASTVAIYVVSLLVLSFLSVLGNTIVLMIHRKDTEERDQGQTSRADCPNPNSHYYNCGHGVSPLHPSLKLHGEAEKKPVTLTAQEDTDFPKLFAESNTSYKKFGGSDLKLTSRSKPRSRAERLNRICFISNSAIVVSLTIAVFIYIFT